MTDCICQIHRYIAIHRQQQPQCVGLARTRPPLILMHHCTTNITTINTTTTTHTHLLHAVSIYGQNQILIKCQRQLWLLGLHLVFGFLVL